MAETRNERGGSDVSHFLEELRSTKRMLSSPVSDALQLRVLHLRSEWAQSMLNAPQFQEAIQLMNEKVLRELYNTPSTDVASLTVLNEKLKVITEFVDELSEMVDRWAEVQQIQEQHNRRQLYGDQYPNQYDDYERQQTEHIR